MGNVRELCGDVEEVEFFPRRREGKVLLVGVCAENLRNGVNQGIMSFLQKLASKTKKFEFVMLDIFHKYPIYNSDLSSTT